ncbi:chemotaxis protein CheW [Chondrinema litorale]|uniref:chemotaxis protein CheW n=1 Tax=Chondrinema litorale TaxID=2994555 RepID=UPI0025439411|nr:chemotaxis protein CheW [Chondrinema litorale]UZR98390.1 chemotaxis protein CheW [Chondrinema litorale]
MSLNEQKINHYIILYLGEEPFAIDVMNVKEILELSKITEVPETPPFLRGIANLRGSLLSVVDLRTKFAMQTVEDTRKTRIVVLNFQANNEQITVGVVVDRVTNVIELNEAEIQVPNDMHDYKRAAYIKGIIHKNDDFIMLIDIEKIFNISEAELLTENV